MKNLFRVLVVSLVFLMFSSISLAEDDYYAFPPQFYDLNSTISLLRDTKTSIARFGDGELDQILGQGETFQYPSPELAYRLREVLSSPHKNIIIGIPTELWFMEGLTEKEKKWWSNCRVKFKPLLKEVLNKDQVYGPTNISHYSMHYTDEKTFDDYFSKVRSIWENKDIHLIHGEGIFDDFKFDIFDNVRTISYQKAPARNAFKEYKKILNAALKVDKNKLIIIILGPTATVLAYDLTLHGYQALDIGHVAKAYDWHKKNWKKIGLRNFFE